MLRMDQQTINAPVFANVWDALADTPLAAANLRLRSEILRQLMRQINALIES
jgi:predicted XRE-type DNA-binding protein